MMKTPPHWVKDIPWQIHSRPVRAVQQHIIQRLKSVNLIPDENATYDAAMCHRAVGQLNLTFLKYGAAMGVDAGKLGRFSILQWPIVGSYDLHAGGKSVHISSGEAHLIAPGVPVRLSLSAECVLLVVRFTTQSAIELGLELGMEDASSRAQLWEAQGVLGVPISLTDSAGASLGRTLDYICQESLFGTLLTRSRAAGLNAQSLLLDSLKDSLSREAVEGTPSPLPMVPRYVQRAERFLLDHLQSEIALEQVAQASGVAASTLSEGFKTVHNVSPMAWWRLKRLDRAYEDLCQAGNSVTDVGLNWGFNHLGRFSKAYSARFGESPRRTQQRAKSGQS